MATYYNPGSITYDSGTNTITVLGGYHTGTILYASDNSTTDFNGKDAFAGTNTPDEVIGRFMWFYDKSIVDNGYADVNDWSNHWAEDYDIEPYVRRIVSGGWEDWGCHPDYPWGFIPSKVSGDLDNYMVSWSFEDIYQADQTNGWGVITKHDTDNYTIDCNLTIGDHDLQTPTFLAQFQGTLNFGIDGNNSLKIYRYGFFQFGQMYGGTPVGGGIMTAYWGSVTDVEGAGIYRVFNTYCQFQMRDQFGFTHYNYLSYNPYFEYNNVSHNAWQSTKGGKYYIASGNPIWTNVKFSHTSADAYRGWNTTIRTSPYLNNVEYSFKASMQYQILGGDVKIIRDLVKGGGSVSFGAISYYGSGDAYVRLINPTNIDITTDFGLSAHSSKLYLLHLQEAQYYNAKLIDSNGILESGVIDITNVNKENLFTATTDVNGQIPQQEIVSREFVTYTSESEATLNSFAPFSIKYFKYGYLPLELSNSFEGAVNESMLLQPDANTNLDYASALAISGVVLNMGTYNDTDGNEYSYNIDCGGNRLEDVYDHINAKLATEDDTDVLGTKCRLVTTQPLTYDGTIFNGSQGFYFTNYVGNIAKQIADDGTVFIPPTSVIYKLTGLQTGTEVRIYQTSDMTELAGIESSTTSFQYSYIHAADIEVVVVIFALGYQPIRIETTLTNENASIPIQQIFDRNYKNPV